MAKKQKTHTKFKLELIRGGVSIWIISSESMSERYPDLSFATDGKTIKQDGCHPVIWINPKADGNKIGILAHEAVHAISFLCEERNIKYDEELYAYSVQYIVENGLKRLPLLLEQK